MAVKRGKSQARRNSGNGGGNGMPGWAWLVIGVLLTLGVILAAPRLLKSDSTDGFFRPKPNPDAQPTAAREDADAVVPESSGDATPTPVVEETPKEREFDFYTLLPGQEVAMSDAELAASAREETARAQREAAQAIADGRTVAALPAATPGATPGTSGTAPTTPAVATAPRPAPPVSDATLAPANPVVDAPYVLQAGAFGTSGDAEVVKAKIAMLGLGARVETATIGGKTMYRVRMGPYGTASELAQAKAKLGSGGLPAMAIRVK